MYLLCVAKCIQCSTKAYWSRDLNAFYSCQSLVQVRMAARKVFAEFCLDDPDFCSCEKCGDKCPEYSPSFRTARDALRNLEPDSMDDFQVPKKRKSTDSASGKEKPSPKKGCLSLKGKREGKI